MSPTTPPNRLTGKEILVTGGTGSLGQQIVRELIGNQVANGTPRGIRIFSRDELKQWKMQRALEEDMERLHVNAHIPVSFLLGDVRDKNRLRRAMEGVDIVFHTAAMKQVPASEDNPLEAIYTNVHGAENVLDAALDCLVEKVMNVSTDKAVNPINLYGATKLCAEKLFTYGNVYSGRRGTKFATCRYGNVLGSRGSVAHVFMEQAKAGKPITITHKDMTRFWITLNRVSRFIISRTLQMEGGEIFVPKMPSMRIMDMAMAMAKHAHNYAYTFNETGIRPGEKLHECLITEQEAQCMREYTGFYKIYDKIWNADPPSHGNKAYHSNTNDEWLTAEGLINMITEGGFAK
jgi:UDP-N-acetylglucosamine 4,6-dehydratase